MATFKIHGETSISVWMRFMITEVHCLSTKMFTNDVYNVRLATDMYVNTVDKKRRNGRFFEVSMASVHQNLQRTIKQTLPQNVDCR